MIIINKGSANTVVLTLTEKVSIANPNFLFEFYNEEEKESQYFIAEDLSTETRYNKFIITETTTPDELEGEVTLTLPGLWSYFVREQASSTNLDPDLSGAIVERGKVRVIGTAETTYTHTPDDTNIVYNG